MTVLSATAALADGASIDKIYHPYVNQLEKELEYRVLLQQDNQDSLDGGQKHRLGYGQALNDRWFTEIYLIGHKEPGQSLRLDSTEVEFKWQLTEQGEYANDWGLLFELERNTQENSWEFSQTLIVLHEWGRWVGTANASLTFEGGRGIEEEWETSGAFQLKYRASPSLEPALELFVGEQTLALGPLLMGTHRLGGRRSLLWQAGLMFGLEKDTPDIGLKGSLAFEF